jgi:hypothetical protein
MPMMKLRFRKIEYFYVNMHRVMTMTLEAKGMKEIVKKRDTITIMCAFDDILYAIVKNYTSATS